MDIKTLPTKELEAELARREKEAKLPKPQYIFAERQDWSSVRTMCADYLDLRANDQSVKSMEGYIFEAAMETVYGKDVWTYLNSLLGE